MKLLDKYIMYIFWALMIPILIIQIRGNTILFKDSDKNFYLVSAIWLVIVMLFAIRRVGKLKESKSKKERNQLLFKIIFLPLLYVISILFLIFYFRFSFINK